MRSYSTHSDQEKRPLFSIPGPVMEVPRWRGENLLFDLIRLVRPVQWMKNIFVLGPLLFSGLITDPVAIVASLLAMVCFCLWSSSVYCMNDVLDAPADRRHPRKKNRPVPSGRVSVSVALLSSLALGMAGFAISTLPLLPTGFVWFGSLYLVNSILYCTLLKHRVIVDVIAIAIGFVLRLLAGCWAIGVHPSHWISICGFSLALLLGFGKRRLEIGALESPTDYRPALQSYTVEKLNMMLSIASAVCLVAYMLYTVSPETISLHGSERLVYTVPIVAYGVFRYLFKVQEGKHDGPVEIFLADRIFALNAILWVAAVVTILYWLKF